MKNPVGRPPIKSKDKARLLTISLPAVIYKKLEQDELVSSSKLIQKLLKQHYKIEG